MRVLISGASIAGPTLAYWLAKFGYEVTIVERAATLRKTGGHAVDLFSPAMDIAERMGVLDRVEAKATGTSAATVFREGSVRPVEVNLENLYTAISDRHVEIMRDDLSEILYDATSGDVEYIFGESIASISDEGKVTFEARPTARTFDLVVGADGLHSNVRRLAFGEEQRFTWLGAYLAVLSLPNYLDLDRHMYVYFGRRRFAGCYSARHMEDARALFVWKTDEQLHYDYRDIDRQKELLRETFLNMGGEVRRWLEELDRTPAFYFDSITQLRMASWSRGRVTLVGDAGYCPGPAIGASTSLSIVGAYVLAGELAEADGDYERAFRAYEREISNYVEGSRALAKTAGRLIPAGRLQAWAVVQGGRVASRIPARLARKLARLNRGVRLHDSVRLKDYGGRRPAA